MLIYSERRLFLSLKAVSKVSLNENNKKNYSFCLDILKYQSRTHVTTIYKIKIDDRLSPKIFFNVIFEKDNNNKKTSKEYSPTASLFGLSVLKATAILFNFSSVLLGAVFPSNATRSSSRSCLRH